MGSGTWTDRSEPKGLSDEEEEAAIERQGAALRAHEDDTIDGIIDDACDELRPDAMIRLALQLLDQAEVPLPVQKRVWYVLDQAGLEAEL